MLHQLQTKPIKRTHFHFYIDVMIIDVIIINTFTFPLTSLISLHIDVIINTFTLTLISLTFSLLHCTKLTLM
jgi:hypothetical protein